MSTKEKRFRNAARAYAERASHIPQAILFAHKGKEVICKVPMANEWSKLFHYNGDDTVTIKNRISDPWGDMISLDAFEIAYGGMA